MKFGLRTFDDNFHEGVSWLGAISLITILFLSHSPGWIEKALAIVLAYLLIFSPFIYFDRETFKDIKHEA